MSSAYDSPVPDIRIKCVNCGVVFFTRYADQKYHSFACKESAAQKRKRARAKLQKEGSSSEGLPAAQPTVVDHPLAKEAFRRDIRERLATPRMQWMQEFVRTHARIPLDHEYPAELQEAADDGLSASERAIKDLFGSPGPTGPVPRETPE